MQITAAETVGVEQRGGYYEGTGSLRDMIPNHLFQLLSLSTMEPPISFEANAVRDEQSKILRSIRPLTNEEALSCAVRGQYGAGTAGNKPVQHTSTNRRSYQRLRPTPSSLSSFGSTIGGGQGCLFTFVPENAYLAGPR